MSAKKKILSPLEIMLQDKSIPTVEQHVSNSEDQKIISKNQIEKNAFNSNVQIINSTNANHIGNIIDINPSDIYKWEFKDRPENELGDLAEFARILKTIGQLQPGIVRPTKKAGYKYELVVGERRWRACKLAGISFRAELIDLSDLEAGLAQAAENKDRKQLSDYARGINYARQIEAGILKQSDLSEKLGTSRQQISRLLSYREIPQELIDAIGDMTKVSPRTAEEIKFICKKDADGLKFLLMIADKIKSGIGYESLQKNYEKLKHPPQHDLSNTKVISKEGRHLFTWRKDGNGNLSISFPKDIRSLINTKKLEASFSASIENLIKSGLSPAGDN